MTVDIVSLVDSFARAAMVGVLASITVGPVAVLCIQRTLSRSISAGLFSGMGIAVADTLMAVAAYFFYAMLQGHIEMYNVLLRVVGGILVVGMGVYIFLQNPAIQLRKNRRGAQKGGWHDFISIFGVTLANFVIVIPYILAFFAVFEISAVTAAVDTTEPKTLSTIAKGLSVCVGFFAGSCCWWSMLVFVISRFKKGFKPRHMLTINHVAGLIIGSLGAFTIISTVASIISATK